MPTVLNPEFHVHIPDFFTNLTRVAAHFAQEKTGRPVNVCIAVRCPLSFEAIYIEYQISKCEMRGGRSCQ